MNIKNTIVGFIVVLLATGCSQNDITNQLPQKINITLKSTNPEKVVDAQVTLDIEKLKEIDNKFNPKAYAIYVNNKEIPSQPVDFDGDSLADHILCLIDFEAKQTMQAVVRYSPDGVVNREYIKRTQAEISHKVGGKFVNHKYEGGEFKNVDFLKVPAEHTDHSYFIRYEGPGWESDKVGYRFYIDWRNAVDIFGKKTSDMILQNVGQDGFDSYHEMADWGMDVLKVGTSLGVGSIGTWQNSKANRVEKTDSLTCEILENGPVFSKIRTTYYGWETGSSKVNLTSQLSIWGGSRITHCELFVDGELENLCTGLAKHDRTEYFIKYPDDKNGWGYMALWGKQSLAGEDDLLGTAIIFNHNQFKSINQDKLNYVVTLQPDNRKVDYYFLAAWVQEPNGIKTRSEFKRYLSKITSQISDPVLVIY